MRWMNGWLGRMGDWMDGYMEGRMDGQDGRVGEWMNR